MVNCNKVIVTGATSFIGNALIRLLSVKGYQIIAITRPNSARRYTLEGIAGVTLVEADLSELENLNQSIFHNSKILFHLGWTNDFVNARYNIEGQMKNTNHTVAAVGLAARSNCQVFVGVGSQAECGRIGKELTENTIEMPETAYAIAKCKAYELSRTKCEQNQIKQCWPRLLSAYGPNDKKRTLVMTCLNACINNISVKLTPCEQIWDYVYVSDVAEALYSIAIKGNHGKRYSIASGRGRMLREYILDIAEVTGNDIILDGIGQKRYEENQVMHLVGDISSTTLETGFIPKVSFKEGLENTVKANFSHFKI